MLTSPAALFEHLCGLGRRPAGCMDASLEGARQGLLLSWIPSSGLRSAQLELLARPWTVCPTRDKPGLRVSVGWTDRQTLQCLFYPSPHVFTPWLILIILRLEHLCSTCFGLLKVSQTRYIIPLPPPWLF